MAKPWVTTWPGPGTPSWGPTRAVRAGRSRCRCSSPAPGTPIAGWPSHPCLSFPSPRQQHGVVIPPVVCPPPATTPQPALSPGTAQHGQLAAARGGEASQPKPRPRRRLGSVRQRWGPSSGQHGSAGGGAGFAAPRFGSAAGEARRATRRAARSQGCPGSGDRRWRRRLGGTAGGAPFPGAGQERAKEKGKSGLLSFTWRSAA